MAFQHVANKHMPVIFNKLHNMETLAGIFHITKEQIQMFQKWTLQYQTYLTKLLGVLFRGQTAYVLFPIVLDSNGLNPKSNSIIWAWAAWSHIGLAIWQIEHITVPETMEVDMAIPWCWTCLQSTSRVCPGCKNVCQLLGLRQIPTCHLCNLCTACFIDQGDSNVQHFIANQPLPQFIKTRRFSFHLADLYENIALSCEKP